MITDRLIQILGMRMYLLNIACISPCNWNKEQKRFQSSGTYSLCNWWLILFGASAYTASLTLRIYEFQGVVFNAGREDERIYLVSETGRRILASLIYLTVDALAWIFIVTLIGVAILIARKRHEFCQVTNGIIELNQFLLKQLKDYNGHEPEVRERRTQRPEVSEEILFLLSVGSIILPIMYGITVLHPYEPVHRTLLEWFDIQPKPELRFFPIIFLVDCGLFFCGNAVLIPLSTGILYIGLCQYWIPGIMPHSSVIFQGKCCYSTKLGLLDENMIIRMYRCQQVINVALNDLFKSKFVSLHHLTILIIFVLSTYLCINYTEDIKAMGPAGLILPAAAIGCGLVEYYETHLLGKILWDSRQFIKSGLRVAQFNQLKGKMFKRFFKSCTDIKLKTAHPFFVVSFDTFLLIVNQGIDFLVSLLVFSD